MLNTINHDYHVTGPAALATTELDTIAVNPYIVTAGQDLHENLAIASHLHHFLLVSNLNS